MRFANAEDLRKIDEFRARKFTFTPPRDSGKFLSTLFQKSKPILLTSLFLYSLHSYLHSISASNLSTWQVQYNINEDLNQIFSQSKLNTYFAPFYHKSTPQKYNLALTMHALSRVQSRVHQSLPISRTQTISIQRKVHYKFYMFEFGVIEKIRELNYRGDLIQRKIKVPITVFGLHVFPAEEVKVIKRNRNLVMREELDIVGRYFELVEKAKVRGEIGEEKANEELERAAAVEKSILVGYELYH